MAAFDLGPHAGFIIASFVICLGVVLGLTAWVWLDRRRLNADLRALEAQGVRRRTAAGTQGQ
ncbi:heme exporter protein CcmD [Pannonibacter phragmitetus]|uniref:Heme exporter protein D n=1 Tax=Pannonibacter phragmitetus TaxID=121719 RepID=A0A0U3P4X6_9HYPH|nr:heme exporter protein CcmD [Pannonibacter phragmitetus]ALV26869.1 heme transporter CcmD [Pannonibacter phragmitetus]